MKTASVQTGVQFVGATLLEPGQPAKVGTLRILSSQIADCSAQPVPGMPTVDAAGSYIIPGLIDCHDHLAFKRTLWAKGPESGELMGQLMHSTQEQMEREFAQNARRVLDQGVSTVRDFGVDHGAALRAGAQDLAERPRIIPAAQPLGLPGGHLAHRSRHVESVQEVENAVADLAREPAQWIKLFASGGIADYPRSPISVELPEKLMRAAVQQSHERGLRVAAHALPEESIMRALRAGVDSIEHGVFLTARAAELMRENGTWYVPTLSGYARRIDALRAAGQHDAANEFEREVLLPHAESVRLAAEAGVRIALGTDITASIVDEAEALMQVAGLDFEHVFGACTKDAAELLGLKDGSGTLDAAARADLVVLGSDPRKDIRALEDIQFVVRAGRHFSPRDQDRKQAGHG